MGKSVKNQPATPPPALPVFVVRGKRVILDADLAAIYGVPTHVFNQAIKRNQERFPEDFAFQLTTEEVASLRSLVATSSLTSTPLLMGDREDAGILTSQFAMSRSQHIDNKDDNTSSQIVMSSQGLRAGIAKHRGKSYLPWAFTEHGAVMAANLLRSERAVRMSVYVVRAFVGMREQLAANATILKRLAEMDKTLLEHDQALKGIWTELQPLLSPPPEPPRRRIGFHGAEGRN